MATPEMKKRLEPLGAAVMATTPEQFRAYVDAETRKWSAVIKSANIHPE